MKSVFDVRASKRYDTSMDRNGKRMIQNDQVQEDAFVNIEKITQGKNLTDTEQTVLEYILDQLDTVQTEGVRGVARANYTSTSTIMRLARKMDYSGFVDACSIFKGRDSLRAALNACRSYGCIVTDAERNEQELRVHNF